MGLSAKNKTKQKTTLTYLSVCGPTFLSFGILRQFLNKRVAIT